MKSDIEIAQEAVLEPITKVAESIGISSDDIELYGKYKAKLSEEYLKKIADNKKGKLVTHNITGYYPNFRMLAETGIPSHILRRADAKSMKALKEQMKKEEEKLAKMAYKAISNLVDDMDKPLR